jgi:hypothetical protein
MTEKKNHRDGERERYLAIGLAIGMPAFGLIGTALCLATGTLGLLGVAPGIGLAIGVAIGEGLYQRSRQRAGRA